MAWGNSWGSGKGTRSWTPVWQPAFQKWGSGKGFGKGKGKSKQIDPKLKVWIGNLPAGVDWKALQAHMNNAGRTKWVEVFAGKGAGTGVAAYSSTAEVANAIAMLNGSELAGQYIQVDVWVKQPKL